MVQLLALCLWCSDRPIVHLASRMASRAVCRLCGKQKLPFLSIFEASPQTGHTKSSEVSK